MKNLFVPSKLDYVKGKKPKVECILCAIRDNDKRVAHLDIYRTENFIVTLNLHPYNPGHLMVFPRRHICDLRELKEYEVLELNRLERMCLDILEKLYQPSGFNLGFNLGNVGGASVDHLHLHIVPRYRNEIGFLDIISGTRIIVENPKRTKRKLSQAFKEYEGRKGRI